MARTIDKARPRVACEISAERVIAGRAAESRDFLETYVAKELRAGAVTPGLAETNLADASQVRDAIGEVLDQVAGRARDIIAVVPDAAVRVVLLEFETLPERAQDAVPIIRLRLKKSLPFDADKAMVSYHVLGRNGAVRTVAAVAPRHVVEEYEAAFRDAGYTPGVVLPSVVGALGAVPAGRPTLLVKAEANTLALAAVDGEDLRLLRVIPNEHGAHLNAQDLAENIYPALVFLEDTYQSKVENVMVAGLVAPELVQAAIQGQSTARVQELVGGRHVALSSASDAARNFLGGVVGALVG
jgi:type IV pilus assembly protein PilM